MNDRIAINKRTALRMFWNAGHDTEAAMLAADAALETIAQPSTGYYYADDVAQLIAGVDHVR